jgi:general secretion pathway protein C
MEKDRVQLEHATLELAHPPVTSKRAAKKMPAMIVTANGEAPERSEAAASPVERGRERGETAPAPRRSGGGQPPELKMSTPLVPAVPAAAEIPAPPLPPAASPAPAKKEVITQDITRSQIEVGLADFTQLSEEVQVQKVDGGGWRLVRVKDGCVLRKLGLKDGDVVRRVSDLPINTFDDAASVYARIRTWDHLTLAVEREGRPVMILVRII